MTVIQSQISQLSIQTTPSKSKQKRKNVNSELKSKNKLSKLQKLEHCLSVMSVSTTDSPPSPPSSSVNLSKADTKSLNTPFTELDDRFSALTSPSTSSVSLPTHSLTSSLTHCAAAVDDDIPAAIGLTIHIESAAESTLTLDILPTETISHLKYLIADILGVSSSSREKLKLYAPIFSLQNQNKNLSSISSSSSPSPLVAHLHYSNNTESLVLTSLNNHLLYPSYNHSNNNPNNHPKSKGSSNISDEQLHQNEFTRETDNFELNWEATELNDELTLLQCGLIDGGILKLVKNSTFFFG